MLHAAEDTALEFHAQIAAQQRSIGRLGTCPQQVPDFVTAGSESRQDFRQSLLAESLDEFRYGVGKWVRVYCGTPLRGVSLAVGLSSRSEVPHWESCF